MLVLGVNAYHGDSAACLVEDGRLVAAAEEERFRRVKHWAGFPEHAIRYCLAERRISLSDLDHIALNRDPRANLGRKLLYLLTRRPSLRLSADRFANMRRWQNLDRQLAERFPDAPFQGRIHHVEHHLAHLASAFLVSPFPEAVALSVDGFGDFASTAWGVGRGVELAVEGRIYFPHSLGAFYQALTQYLGFPHYGDEYKVMGLAPYGQPRHVKTLERIVRRRSDGGFELDLRYFRHHREEIGYRWDNCQPTVGPLFTGLLEELLGPARRPGEPLKDRHRDLARSVQVTYEEALFELLRRRAAEHPSPAVVLAGGCAYNSVANGKVTARTPFRQLYIQPAAGDAGGAIGAAFLVWHRRGAGERRFVLDHSYWGPSFADDELVALLTSRQSELTGQRCTWDRVSDERELCERAARAIAEGAVVGWFGGRMEWGPRALGNRSILCDPRRADIRDVLNLKIKRRESFRPFAPSIQREAVPEWFETEDDAPFMMKVLQVRDEKRALIPAVTHVDGSGRLQTVRRETNSRYYELIEHFRRLTGVPMVLNTSFNENEPVVCRPDEALDCFLRTRMDVLVLGDHFVRRA